MVDSTSASHAVGHAGYAPGEFPSRWVDGAYALHCAAWGAPWEGRLDRDRFQEELASDHVDVLFDADDADGALLAFVKWKATQVFFQSRDRLSDPALRSISSAPPACFVCAYEITATNHHSWHGLGRRLLSEAMKRWERDYAKAVYCTYSPKRGLTATLRRLAESEQHGRPALDAFAHRAGAAAARRIDDWVRRLGRPVASFIRDDILPVPDERMIPHLSELSDCYGRDVIDGVVAAIGIAYNFVLRARSGTPVCGPAAFHRALGAEQWRQYPGSATNCADALGLVDHWRYSHDPERRETCARLFREHCTARARESAASDELVVLA